MNFTVETNLLVVAGITLLAVISPGPDFAITVRNAVRHGRRPGLATALGIACGVVCHVAYTLLGLGYLVARFAWLLTAVKYMGAAYLVWLGCSALFFRAGPEEGADVPGGAVPSRFRDAFRNGFLCNLLNPKTVLFFLALFTQVVEPGTTGPVRAGIGAYIVLAHFVWFAFVALALTSRRAMCVFERWRRSVEKGVGACLVFLGAALALDV